MRIKLYTLCKFSLVKYLAFLNRFLNFFALDNKYRSLIIILFNIL